MPKSMVLLTVLLLVVMLMMVVVSVSCQQAGLSEEEIKSIVHKEVIAEVSQQRTTVKQLEAEATLLKAQIEDLNRRVMFLEGQLQLAKAADTEDIEKCLGEIVRYIDDLDWYLNDVSAYLDNSYRYLQGWTSFLWMPPSGPPSWSPIHCFKFELRF